MWTLNVDLTKTEKGVDIKGWALGRYGEEMVKGNTDTVTWKETVPNH